MDWQPETPAKKRRAPSDIVGRLRATQLRRMGELLDKLHERAMDGDNQAAKLLMDACLPSVKPRELPLATAIDAGESWRTVGVQILHLMATGKLGTDTGGNLLEAMASYVAMGDNLDVREQRDALLRETGP